MSQALLYLLIFVATSGAALVVFAGVCAVVPLPHRTRWALFAVSVLGYAALLALQPGSWFVSDVAVLAVAILFGATLGNTLSSRQALSVFVVVAASMDLYSFSGGLTARIIAEYRSGTSLLLQYLSLSIPGGARIIPVVGVGDLIILGGIYASLRRLRYPAWECFIAPWLGLIAALVVGLIVGGIYALPFVALAVISYVWLRQTDVATP